MTDNYPGPDAASNRLQKKVMAAYSSEPDVTPLGVLSVILAQIANTLISLPDEAADAARSAIVDFTNQSYEAITHVDGLDDRLEAVKAMAMGKTETDGIVH